MGEQWLNGYSGQTTDQLMSLADRYRTDSIVLAFEQAIAAKADRLGERQLSRPERIVLAVEALEREVNSDGYFGLFSTQAEYVSELVSALTAIGATAAADITGSAIEALAMEGPVTAMAVEAAIARDDADRDSVLSSCDQAYYREAGDHAPALLAYIHANRDEIVLP